MKKKVLSCVLCTMMAVFLLTGCGSPNDGDQEADSGGNKVTLSFWGWEASELESKSIQEGIEAFEKQNPNITVKYMSVPQADFHAKLKTALVSGDGPDVFYLDATQCKDFVNAGLLMDLTDVASDFTEDMTRASLEKVTMTDEKGEEHIYGLDICNVGPVIFYNKDLFEKAGIEAMPTKMEERWTWDEFVENMKKLTIVNDAGDTVQYGTCNWEEQYSMYVLQYMLELNGASWYNEEMTKAVNVNSEESREVLNKIKSLRADLGVAPDPNAAGSDSGNSPTTMFLTGKVASIAIGSYALQEIAASDINYGVGLFPTLGKNDNDAFFVSADMKAINAGTEHPQEALLLAEYMSSADFGIPIYQTGLWMPNKESLYKEENLDLWFNQEVYPEGWENLLEIFRNAKDKPTDKLSNVNEINDAVDEELQAFYYADQKAETTLNNIEERVNAALDK